VKKVVEPEDSVEARAGGVDDKHKTII
jgi:hypothetical protein